MHSATPATGRPLPPRGKSLPKSHPVPLSCRPARQLATPNPHVTYVTSHPKCYIPAPAPTPHAPRVTGRAKFNRQPRRLEFTVSRTKQTPAPRFNRQQITTSKITHPSISNRYNQKSAQAPTRHSSLITHHCLSSRHTPRLENAISHRKQTVHTRSNRHFLQVSGSYKLRIAEAHRPPQAASKNVSNRQRQILEINVNLSKQTIAPRSNRHKNAILSSPKFHITTERDESQATASGSPLTNHASFTGTASDGSLVDWRGCCGGFAFGGRGDGVEDGVGGGIFADYGIDH
jgi:hypothetical protein